MPPTSVPADDEIRFRAKRELRKRYRTTRAAFPPGALAQRSLALADRVTALDSWRDARTVALFASMPDEVQTGALIEQARREGRTVALPVVRDETRVLEFRDAFDGDRARPLEPSAFGVPEPAQDAPVVPLAAIDLVLVPCIAVDPYGHRIGYGAGYYDQTLPLAVNAVRVAVAFDFQLIAEVPARAGDVRVSWIVTDRRTMAAEALAASNGP